LYKINENKNCLKHESSSTVPTLVQICQVVVFTTHITNLTYALINVFSPMYNSRSISFRSAEFR